MTTTIRLHIGQALPQGDARHSEAVLGLWRQLQRVLRARTLSAACEINGPVREYQVSLDAGELLALMEKALRQSRSFNEYLEAHIADQANTIDAALQMTLAGGDEPNEIQGYQVACIFLQQLVLAANLVLPGSICLLGTRFGGPAAHRYEAQQFDSRILHGAGQTAESNRWPPLQRHDPETVWAWLDSCGASRCHTAIKGINKVLFTLLKVAEQRHEYSARTVLLITYQLEMLLDCRGSGTPAHVRKRLRMVLGRVPETADCLAELFDVRNSLFVADQPVHRPPLICHTTAAMLREQIGQHNSAVEAGIALVLALLHDLIGHDAQDYEFTEAVTRV